MNEDKIIADYVRAFHGEILADKKYKIFKTAYPQIEQMKEAILPAMQIIAEAIQPALDAISDAIIEQEQEGENESAEV